MTNVSGLRKRPFLAAVFLMTFSSLLFQILQTRIMSVIAWYCLAFFAISVAMLGMTVGAVWVYLWRERFPPAQLPITLCNFALLTALAMPASIVFQFCLVTSPALSLTTVVSWILLVTVMAVPYVFAGVVVSLALTRSPFPAGQVYGVDPSRGGTRMCDGRGRLASGSCIQCTIACRFHPSPSQEFYRANGQIWHL